jgi:flagellar hook-basal body complex protein FliE
MSSIGSTGAVGIQQIMALRQQIVDRSTVLQDIRGSGGPAPAAPTDGSDKFAGALRGALDQVNASQLKADSLSDAYERGDGVDIAKVMLARQEAGVAFEATLQVRNKLLSAYQDIMRTGV